jgi:anion-transporting  ArsA/GET3 family ATPase
MSDQSARDKLDSLTDLQFLYVTGKGGVGKSTIAAVLGLHAARRGLRTLVVVPQTSHNTPSLFGHTLSTEPQTVTGNLSAVRVSPDEAMREYCRQVLHSQTLTNALFHPKVAGGFLAGIPGLTDWALLGKSWAWTRSGTFALPKNQQRYDLVIFDAPASGDGTKMLKVPQVILDLSPQGRLRDDAAACLQMLGDPKRSSVLLVTLAEDFAITETEENLLLLAELKLPVGPILVNRVLEPRLRREDIPLLHQLTAQLSSSAPTEQDRDALALVRAGLRYAGRWDAQQKQLARLRSRPGSDIEIPEIIDDFDKLPALSQLLDRIITPKSRIGANPHRASYRARTDG